LPDRSSNNMKLVHWPVMCELLPLISSGGNTMQCRAGQRLLCLVLLVNCSSAFLFINTILFNAH